MGTCRHRPKRGSGYRRGSQIHRDRCIAPTSRRRNDDHRLAVHARPPIASGSHRSSGARARGSDALIHRLDDHRRVEESPLQNHTQDVEIVCHDQFRLCHHARGGTEAQEKTSAPATSRRRCEANGGSISRSARTRAGLQGSRSAAANDRRVRQTEGSQQEAIDEENAAVFAPVAIARQEWPQPSIRAAR